jgi:hypothetical protein
MKTIVIKSQAEWDALPERCAEYTEIVIRASVEIEIHETPGSSTVRAYGSSTVRAYGSSTVMACDSSTVTAYDSSTVRAYGSSTVRAYGSSTVTACGQVAIHAESPDATLVLLGLAVAFLNKNAKATLKSKTARAVVVKAPSTVAAWCSNEGADVSGGNVILFKRVSSDFKTQEGTPNETAWLVGSTATHANWSPEEKECGVGKFHACAAPHFCDQYRDTQGDKYVAIQVSTKDCHVWPKNPEHPHKIAFRKGTVLHECDIHGRKIG